MVKHPDFVKNYEAKCFENQFIEVFIPDSKTGHPETMTVQDARALFSNGEFSVKTSNEEIISSAEEGIVFIDEIDKICRSPFASQRESGVSNEGVQRDLLPIVEGTMVETSYGAINTEGILFIAAGSFSNCKPSDLMPELQGRFPIRAELKELSEQNLYDILCVSKNNVLDHQKMLLSTENLKIEFTDDAIREIAHVTFTLNKNKEDLGARRLSAVVEKVIEEISFETVELESPKEIIVDKEFVIARTNSLLSTKKSLQHSHYVI